MHEAGHAPSGGGQPADRGTLTADDGTVSVVTDVQRVASGAIVHTVSAPLSVGTPVAVNVDWDRRFDHMQHHTVSGNAAWPVQAKSLDCSPRQMAFAKTVLRTSMHATGSASPQCGGRDPRRGEDAGLGTALLAAHRSRRCREAACQRGA